MLSKCMLDISVSVTCNNIGRILQELGKFREAIYYYQRALKSDYCDVASQGWNSKGVKGLHIPKNRSTRSCPSTANLYSTVWYNLGLIHYKVCCMAMELPSHSTC